MKRDSLTGMENGLEKMQAVEKEKEEEQAGAELCQAQVKLG